MPFLTPETTPVATVCRRLFIPDSPEWLALVNGALAELIKLANWEAFGAVTPAEAANRAQQLVLEYLESACMIGTIHPYVTSSPPSGCLPCDGSYHNRADYPRLYAALPAALVADEDTFQTPDLRDRFIYGAGALAPLAVGGAAEITLTETQLPAHSHTTQPHSHTEIAATAALINGGLEAPASAAVPSPATTGAASVVVNSTGGGQPHDNMPPYFVLAYCIVAR
jgi:microcystin-dependent protein